MSERWTQEDRKKITQMTPLAWGIIVGLGVFAFGLMGYSAWRVTSKASDTASIIGEWQADDPPWQVVFRPDKTVGFVFNGSSAPTSLAPLVMTPGVEVPGRYSKNPDGTYQLRLQNGKAYEASIGKYVTDRFDLTDADGASAVLTFKKLQQPAPVPGPAS
jgi:hypothetical protein